MPTPNPPSDLPPAGKLFVSEPGEGATDDVIANDFSANTNQVDRSKYRGRYVAWSTDGRSVIDADPSLSALLRRMTRRGKNDFVVEGIPDC
jgi:hypothetical protein